MIIIFDIEINGFCEICNINVHRALYSKAFEI